MSSRTSRPRTTTWSPPRSGRRFNLLRSITARQLVSAAGRSLLVERTYSFSGYQINSRDLRERASARPWRRTCVCTATPTKACASCGAEGDTRVVEPPKSRVRSLLGGVLYDGAYDFPIPLAGISVVDYDFRGDRGRAVGVLRGPDPRHERDEARRRPAPLWHGPGALGDPQHRAASSRGAKRFVGQGLWRCSRRRSGLRANWQARPGVNLGASSYLSASTSSGPPATPIRRSRLPGRAALSRRQGSSSSPAAASR